MIIPMKWLVDYFLWRIYHGGEQLMIKCVLFCTYKEIKMYSSLSLPKKKNIPHLTSLHSCRSL